MPLRTRTTAAEPGAQDTLHHEPGDDRLAGSNRGTTGHAERWVQARLARRLRLGPSLPRSAGRRETPVQARFSSPAMYATPFSPCGLSPRSDGRPDRDEIVTHLRLFGPNRQSRRPCDGDCTLDRAVGFAIHLTLKNRPAPYPFLAS